MSCAAATTTSLAKIQHLPGEGKVKGAVVTATLYSTFPSWQCAHISHNNK
jgi:hypothetical protein